MAPNDRGMKNGGGKSRGESKQVVKKGPWTTTEDTILTEYVKKHGEGNWNAVQRNFGLMRCGKSCRLRWANHLRPNLKKGAFSLEEERAIIKLHAKLGNKWARMAAQLPGRTDNEIKNYWNTRLKRRQRAGLPIYPQELQSQNQQEHNQAQSLFSSPLDHQRIAYNNPPSLSLLGTLNPSTMKPPFCDTPKGLPMTLPSSMRISQFSSLPVSLPNNNFGHGLLNSMPVPSFQQTYPNFCLATNPFMEDIPSNQNELIFDMGINSINFPSGQLSMPVTNASSSENTSSGFGSSDANNYANVAGLSRGNSGLLEDLLEESETLARDAKIEGNNYFDLKEQDDNYEGKSLWEAYGLVEKGLENRQDGAILTEESVYNFAHVGDVTINNNSESSSSDPNASPGTLQGINQVEEDLMCLLYNFPLGIPVSDWDDEKDDQKINSNIATNDQKAGNQAEDSSKSQVVITTTSGPKKHYLELEGCCWNNMPSFC